MMDATMVRRFIRQSASRVKIIVLFLWCISIVPSLALFEEKVCSGTSEGLVEPPNHEENLIYLKWRYKDCTFVDGNLELTWLRDKDIDLDFLHSVREVTGYVLVYNVGVRRILLPNLRIIRGEKLMKISTFNEDFSLLVTLSTMETLEMPLLREVTRGSVGYMRNLNLCHWKTIKWNEIIIDSNSHIVDQTQEVVCPPCDSSCSQGCWGNGPENCQQLDDTACSSECHRRKCFGTKNSECCHSECAFGCKGPLESDCFGCQNFYDDGICVRTCPKPKLIYGSTCVQHCPPSTYKTSSTCELNCPPGKVAINRECISCHGPCPKVCLGTNLLHSGNIDSYKDCTIIDGSLVIKDISFNGFQKIDSNFIPGPHYLEMHPDQLNVFSTVKEITGHLEIKASHPGFTNLSYFRNLETIQGRSLTNYQAALLVESTSLKYLGLSSFKKIISGGAAILENKYLCYVETINWETIKQSKIHKTLITSNRQNEECRAQGSECSEQCSSNGCWGPGRNNCISCAHYKVGDLCLDTCKSSTEFPQKSYQDDEVCFTSIYLPPFHSYIVNENLKQLVDVQNGGKNASPVYVTSQKVFELWSWITTQSGDEPGAIPLKLCDAVNTSKKEIKEKSCSNQQAVWVKASKGFVPVGAFIGGSDPICPLYVGRALYEGDLLPGKVCRTTKTIFVPWGGKEHTISDYEVLTGSNFEWVPATGTKIPPCAVPGGTMIDGNILYIGRHINEPYITVGKVFPLSGLLYYPFNGLENPTREYEILVFKTTA